MDSAGTKRCRVCGVDKPLAEMSRRKDRKDGYDTCCLACHRLKTKRWAAAIPEKVIAKRKKFYEQNPSYDRDYHQANAEKKRLAVREWSRTHAEQKAETNRRWRERHAQRERERKHRWVEEHREEKRALDRRRSLANPERVRASRRRSEQANPEAGRIRKHRRRAKLKGSGGSFSVEEWHMLKAEYGNQCLSCQRKESDVQLHQDHIIPIDKGGSNTIDNIQPLCRECNSRKGTKIIDYRPSKENCKD